MSDIGLRPMKADDLPCVLAWRNHPEVRRYMYTQHEITLEEHERWFTEASREACKHLLIFELRGEPMGFANITQKNAGPIAEWGFYLSPRAPKGSGRQLGKRVLTFAFGDLNLHKLCGQALAYNERSVRFHLNMGFQQEGLLRDQHFDGKEFHSVLCFGLLRIEWRPELGDNS
jgi:UDP-4-amino-4,6-dideoxy-N-acetyl-beta-L-altrosamine N-acetyltransferase